MLHDIQIQLKLPEDVTLSNVTGPELATAMDLEIDGVEKWFKEQGNAPLVGVEKSILKTFLAWKIRFER